MPESTIDNKKISFRVITFVGLFIGWTSLVSTGALFYHNSQAQYKDFERLEEKQKYDRERSARLVQNQSEITDYKMEIMKLKMQLDQCSNAVEK